MQNSVIANATYLGPYEHQDKLKVGETQRMDPEKNKIPSTRVNLLFWILNMGGSIKQKVHTKYFGNRDE